MTRRLWKWFAGLIALALLVLLVPATLMEIGDIAAGRLENEIAANRIGNVSQYCRIAMVLAILFCFLITRLPDFMLTMIVMMAGVLCGVLVADHLIDRKWRTDNFPAPSDEVAWKGALRKAEKGGFVELQGRDGKRLIWYVKSGNPPGATIALLVRLIPFFMLLSELLWRPSLRTTANTD